MIRTVCFLLLVLILVSSCSVFKKDPFANIEPAAKIELPAIFGDNMVLQQGQTIKIWGTASPGRMVTIQFNNQTKRALVSGEGNWRISLKPEPVGGPFVLNVLGLDTLNFKNIMVGEVWVCSGQSNMEWSVANSKNPNEEITHANYPNIRLITVKRALSNQPKTDFKTDGWVECSPNTIENFSAVGYYFGRTLYQNLDIPIGLIHTSWGGTPSEAWTSSNSLKKLDDFRQLAIDVENDTLTEEVALKRHQQKVNEWNDLVAKNDIGLNANTTWKDVNYDISDWKSIQLPQHWEEAGLPDFNGLVWFRKEIEIPESWKNQDLTVNLGPIDDVDVTWFNGQKIGNMDRYNQIRKYNISSSLVNISKNNISVRVLDTGGAGGFWGKPEQMKLYSTSGDSISLAGEWYFQASLNLADLPQMPRSPRNSNRSTVLYNAMIAPLIPFAIKGAIWYQGESNAGRAFQYRTLFPTMINDWRTNWRQGDFPFIFVQLANYQQTKPEPVDDSWAELREAQLMTLSLPNTGMAVTIDIGEANDIHPKNKQDVGKRLALNALNKVYNKNVKYSGPMYKSMSIDGNKIRLKFEHTADGLVAKGEKLTGFAIAGSDQKYVWAEAKIEGKNIIVSSPQITSPVAVRYAWATNPICNLYNSEGLPASPFRTEDWPGITQPKMK